MVVVVGTEELDAEAGQLLLERPVERTRSRRKPYTNCRPCARSPSAWAFSAGSSPDDGARTPDEKLSERAVSGRACRHEFD